MAKKNEKTYEEALLKLEELVNILEDPATPIEQATELYKQGIDLAVFCDEKLTKIEGEIAILKQTSQGLLKKQPTDEFGS